MKDGQLHHRTQDITGQNFGLLTCTSPAESDRKKRSWRFLCECGNSVVKVGTEIKKQLARGYIPSCGCLTRKLKKRAKGHGMSKTPMYAVYHSMLGRCTLPSHQAWKNYGARGISVCEGWQTSFEAFWADMGDTYKPGLTLDRVDNDQGYSKDNCRWVTHRIQSNNKRNNVRIPTRWGSLTVAEASRKSGVKSSTIHYRLNQGWPANKLLIAASLSNRLSTT